MKAPRGTTTNHLDPVLIEIVGSGASFYEKYTPHAGETQSPWLRGNNNNIYQEIIVFNNIVYQQVAEYAPSAVDTSSHERTIRTMHKHIHFYLILYV